MDEFTLPYKSLFGELIITVISSTRLRFETVNYPDTSISNALIVNGITCQLSFYTDLKDETYSANGVKEWHITNANGTRLDCSWPKNELTSGMRAKLYKDFIRVAGEIEIYHRKLLMRADIVKEESYLSMKRDDLTKLEKEIQEKRKQITDLEKKIADMKFVL